jgi:RNA polymerase sigma-70 factor (ECF subfamily)
MAIDVGAPPQVGQVIPLTLDEAFRLHAGFVAAVAHRFLGRDSDVDDVVQDVFLDAMKGLAQLREVEAIRGWLKTVTLRKCRRRLRVRRLKGMLGFDDAPSYAEVASPGATPEDRALLTRLYAALDTMPTELRLAYVLRVLEEEKLEDVARLSGCSLATAKRRIAAAERTIQEKFSDG